MPLGVRDVPVHGVLGTLGSRARPPMKVLSCQNMLSAWGGMREKPSSGIALVCDTWDDLGNDGK